jgi:hypothetical protein
MQDHHGHNMPASICAARCICCAHVSAACCACWVPAVPSLLKLPVCCVCCVCCAWLKSAVPAVSAVPVVPAVPVVSCCGCACCVCCGLSGLLSTGLSGPQPAVSAVRLCPAGVCCGLVVSTVWLCPQGLTRCPLCLLCPQVCCVVVGLSLVVSEQSVVSAVSSVCCGLFVSCCVHQVLLCLVAVRARSAQVHRPQSAVVHSLCLWVSQVPAVSGCDLAGKLVVSGCVCCNLVRLAQSVVSVVSSCALLGSSLCLAVCLVSVEGWLGSVEVSCSFSVYSW